MKNVNIIALSACASLAAIALSAPAMAQDVKQDAVDQSTDDEDIIVTAQKRSENLQKTPIALTAVTGEALVSQGITNGSGLSRIAPSVKVNYIGQQLLIFVRGIGSSLTGGNIDPAVATNANGIYLPSGMAGSAFFDLERVEVVPGPQGTLYGRNSSGGTINLITRRPGTELAANAYIEYGNYQQISAFAGVDVPLSNNLSIRVAALSQRHDPYTKGSTGRKSGTNEQDDFNLRGSLLFTPTDRTSIFATFTHSHSGGIGIALQNWPIEGDPYELPADAQALGFFQDFDTDIASLEIRQDISDDITLTSLSGYARGNRRSKTLLSETGPLPLLVVGSDRSYSQELRLAGETGPVDWLAGLYVYDSKTLYGGEISTPFLLIDQGPYNADSNGYAAFGQVTFSVTDSLRVVGGLRYSNDTKALSGTNVFSVPGAFVNTTTYAGKSKRDRVDWKIGFEADIAPTSLLYGSAQTGFNQGGFSNAVATLNPADRAAVPYQPAVVTAFTIGSKNTFFGRRLQLNLEAFYYNYKNYQVSARDLGTGASRLFNAQKAVTYGLQIDSRLKITENDDLFANIGLLEAEAKKLILPNGSNFSGFSLPEAPKLTITAGYQHEWQLASGANITGRTSVEYKSGTWGTYDHARGTFKPKFAKIDAELAYHAASDRWSVSLWGRNLTDKATVGILNGGANPGPAGGFIDDPRTYGMRLSAKF